MDVQMPEIDGYEATRRIRAIEDKLIQSGVRNPQQRIPIIALTANVFREDIEKSLNAGMNGHIGKPINVEDLIGVLQKYLTST